MPTQANPMRIVVPSHATFKEFVMDMNEMNSNGESFEGLCIEIFHKVLELFRRRKFEKKKNVLQIE